MKKLWYGLALALGQGVEGIAAACRSGMLLPGPPTPANGTGPSTKIAALRADDAGLAAKARAAVLELYSLDERLSRGAGAPVDSSSAQRELIAAARDAPT